jgi:hypothetical protein
MLDTNVAIDVGSHAAFEALRKLQELADTAGETATRGATILIGMAVLRGLIDAFTTVHFEEHPELQEGFDRTYEKTLERSADRYRTRRQN